MSLMLSRQSLASYIMRFKYSFCISISFFRNKQQSFYWFCRDLLMSLRQNRTRLMCSSRQRDLHTLQRSSKIQEDGEVQNQRSVEDCLLVVQFRNLNINHLSFVCVQLRLPRRSQPTSKTAQKNGCYSRIDMLSPFDSQVRGQSSQESQTGIKLLLATDGNQ